MMERITLYLQGKLTEDESIELWKELLFDEQYFEILETYFDLRLVYNK